jgi:hypothetical protein
LLLAIALALPICEYPVADKFNKRKDWMIMPKKIKNKTKIKKPVKKELARVIHFEIHAVDQAKLSQFYADVFGWKFKEWKMPPGTPDENRYWAILTAPEDSKELGINGGMMIRRGPLPTGNEPLTAYICTINVNNFDNYIRKIEAAGGTVIVPKMAIPGMAWLGYCKDPEGNIFGVFQTDKKAK